MLSRSVSRHGFRVDAVSVAAEALERAQGTAYDAAILDVVMPGQDGVALASALRKHLPDLPIVLLTGYTHSPLLIEAERVGARVFTKPVAVQEIVEYLKEQIR